MSHDFSQYDQSLQNESYPPGYQPAPRKSGCGRGCIIGIIILVVLGALFIGGLLWIGHTVAQGMTNDPVEVNKRLKQRFPTAQLPPGYSGMFGLKFDLWLEMNMMVFGDNEAEVAETGEALSGSVMLLFSVKAPGLTAEQLEDGLKITRNDGKVIEKKPYTLRVDNYEFAGAFQKIMRDVDGQGQITLSQVLLPLGDSTMLVMQSDQDKIDEAALRRFLSSIASDCPAARRLDPQPRQ